jgi:mannose-6-phosphate isomerase-like protein (cupin superfamily)
MKHIKAFKIFESEDSNIKGFKTDIETDTDVNNDFRKTLYTSNHMQLVLMCLSEEEEIGEEIHDNDQFFRFEVGNGMCIINGHEYDVKAGDCVIIPAGAKHNIINTGRGTFKMYTIYAPPHHRDGTIHITKKDAEESHEEFDGKTTE